MRVVVDLQGAQSSESRFRGIGRYTLALALEFIRQRGEHEVFVALNGAFPDAIESIRTICDGLLPQKNIIVWSAPQPTADRNPANENRRWQAEACRAAFLADLEPDWLVVTSLFEGFADDAVATLADRPRYKTAVVLYDLILWIHQNLYLANQSMRRWYFGKIDQLRRSDLLLAISASTGQEAVDYLGFEKERVVNISTAANAHFRPLATNESDFRHLAKRYGLGKRFVMYTGGIDHRKNIERLIQAFARLPDAVRADCQLAVVCSVHDLDRDRLIKLALSAGLADGEVILTGFVPDDDLVRLYNACTLFVFPSWHEGFGLPVLEAMQCGRPVLASNRSSLPEVMGCDQALFDPFDVADMAAKMNHALSDDAFRVGLARHGLEQAKKFSWEKTAQRTWTALTEKESAGSQRTPMPLQRMRPRMAFVSPLPPERSGIADYSAELLRDLTRWYRIDVVLKEPDGLADDYVRANCGVLSVDEFRAKAGSYDRVLYHFGNSDFHDHMFGLLREIPGVVVLHDFFLSGIQAWGEEHRTQPYIWTRSLATSHGYHAVAERFRAQDTTSVIYKYPANLPVLEDALGVIVHSLHNLRLAERWYGSCRDWAVIPLLRTFEVETQRRKARERLGIDENTVLVCSFGLLGPLKLNHRLLDAWLGSRLAKDPNAQLVFVGATDGDYGEQIERRIRESKAGKPIQVTGWADAAVYRDWLAATDVAVQLRTRSRGETSAAVLDCMNFGLATVVNANGSLGELDRDAVWMLPDEFSDAQLIEALEALVEAPDKRHELGEKGRDVIHRQHAPRRCAERYAQFIEGIYTKAESGVWGRVRDLAGKPDAELTNLARHLSRNHPPQPRLRQLLLDVSELVQRDVKTGIQRVVRALLSEWLETPPAGLRIEPVYADSKRPGYRYARRFTCRFLDIPDDWAEDEPVEAWPGDIFLGLDLAPNTHIFQKPFFHDLRMRYISVQFLVYDLLCVQMPQYFIEGASKLFSQWLGVVSSCDRAICISKTVADDLSAWVKENIPTRPRPLQISWFHIAADIDNSLPSTGLPAPENSVLPALRNRPSFLMVGTIEPRKGYEQVLDGLEALWQAGEDVGLVIVGKTGWRTEKLVARLLAHPEQGRRLFWLRGTSDEYLEQIYAGSTALIAASFGEGFGLPLREASRHGVPIIARDIPVFREVAGDHAFYFPNAAGPGVVFEAVRNWLALWRQGRHPAPEGMPCLTWKESAAQLLDRVLCDTD